MRVGEALRLKRSQIDWAEGVLTVHASKFGNYAEDAVMPSPVTVGVACGDSAQNSSA